MITIDTTHKHLEIVFFRKSHVGSSFVADSYKALGLLLAICRFSSPFNVFNSSVFFTSILLDLTCSSVPFCGILNFSVTFDPLKLCKEELPNLFVTAHDFNKYSIRLLLMSEFEIRDLFFAF